MHIHALQFFSNQGLCKAAWGKSLVLQVLWWHHAIFVLLLTSHVHSASDLWHVVAYNRIGSKLMATLHLGLHPWTKQYVIWCHLPAAPYCCCQVSQYLSANGLKSLGTKRPKWCSSKAVQNERNMMCLVVSSLVNLLQWWRQFACICHCPSSMVFGVSSSHHH